MIAPRLPTLAQSRMHLPTTRRASSSLVLLLAAAAIASASAATANALSAELMHSSRALDAPVANAAYVPAGDAAPGAAFAGVLSLAQSAMRTQPTLDKPLIDGRDARLFPGVRLGFFSMGDVLVPFQRGEMVKETAPGRSPSYWQVIPQFGRIWKEKGDGEWSRAAFPLMLVNDTENHAHQGLATFLYRGSEVTAVRFQFVQQTTPYLITQHFVAWGQATATLRAAANDAEAQRLGAARELADRMPARPWSDLVKSAPPHSLDDFGAPLRPNWIVITALVRSGTLYYSDSATPYGPFPYPLEMRFGPRSIMKSIGVPLALLRLAQEYGPYVLDLKVGDYVNVADPKYRKVRFIDAADMATGMGGDGSLKTNPNDIGDGYVDPHYDAWYLAHSQADKMREIDAHNRPYPWAPGTVMRYRDHDFYLLGAALDAFLKSVRGPNADIWNMLRAEVLEPIGIHHAPLVRTREADGKPGLPWFCAGYYPTLDDLAKIATLYQEGGAHGGVQILDRALTASMFTTDHTIRQSTDMSLERGLPPIGENKELLYKMGFHFYPYVAEHSGKRIYLPTMRGSTGNFITLYPNRVISMRLAKAWPMPKSDEHSEESPLLMMKAVDQIEPF
jgi:hypothetical protein